MNDQSIDQLYSLHFTKSEEENWYQVPPLQFFTDFILAKMAAKMIAIEWNQTNQLQIRTKILPYIITTR